MNLRHRETLFEILLVEDSPIAIKLAQEVLSESEFKNNLHVVSDSDDALCFLRQTNHYANAPRPHLIFLDLNLGARDGKEILTEVKVDPNLRSIPVIVLTSSRAERDIAATYSLQANCYVIKPVDAVLYLDLLKNLSHFWLRIATLPSA